MSAKIMVTLKKKNKKKKYMGEGEMEVWEDFSFKKKKKHHKLNHLEQKGKTNKQTNIKQFPPLFSQRKVKLLFNILIFL